MTERPAPSEARKTKNAGGNNVKRVVRIKADDGRTVVRIEATIESNDLTQDEARLQARSVADSIVGSMRTVRWTDFDATNVRVN